MNKAIINALEEMVCEHQAKDCTGHDWWHVQRVRNLALYIAKQEKADAELLDLAALLHDVDDWKLQQCEAVCDLSRTRNWLAKLSVKQEVIEQVCTIIEESSFKGAKVDTPCSSLEAKILQDADRLDALGAIGIARTFAYGGFKSRPIYDPAVKVVLHESTQAYRQHEGTTLNHFYEKLLLIKDRMNTDTGKRLAQERHAVMEQYLKCFLDEWNFNKSVDIT